MSKLKVTRNNVHDIADGVAELFHSNGQNQTDAIQWIVKMNFNGYIIGTERNIMTLIKSVKELMK